MKLYPPIESVRRQRIGASDMLIMRAEQDKTVYQKLADSPWADWLKNDDDSLLEQQTDQTEVGIRPPLSLSKDIMQRALTWQTQRTHMPMLPFAGQAGLIVEIGSVPIELEQKADFLFTSPVHALLLEPTDETDVWYCFMVANETSYAGAQDIVLQENDGVWHPCVGMVLTWQPVYVHVKAITEIVGRIDGNVLRAIRQWMNYWLMDGLPAETARPGQLVERHIGSVNIVTGSVLGDINDPRWAWREIYDEVSFVFTATRQWHTAMALEKQSAPNVSANLNWWSQLFSWPANLFTPAVVPVLSSENPTVDAVDLQYGKAIFRCFNPNNNNQVVIELYQADGADWALSVKRSDGIVIENFKFDPENRITFTHAENEHIELLRNGIVITPQQ